MVTRSLMAKLANTALSGGLSGRAPGYLDARRGYLDARRLPARTPAGLHVRRPPKRYRI